MTSQKPRNPSAELEPANLTTTLGSTFAFRVNATGAGQLTYQWQRNGVNLANATSFTIVEHIAKYDRAKKKWFRDSTGVWGYLTPQGIFHRRGTRINVGAASFNNPALLIGPNFLVLKNVNVANAGTYRCVVTNPGGSTNSNAATLTVN